VAGVARGRGGRPAAGARDGRSRNARVRRRGPRAAPERARAGRPALPALRRADRVPRSGRREPDRVLVSDVPARSSAPPDRVLTPAVRAPHLEQRLRAFCLAAFAIERGAELPFAFEEHPTRNGPSLYEFRPLVRGFVESQAPTLRRLPDARNAIDDLRREPAAAIFAQAHAR